MANESLSTQQSLKVNILVTKDKNCGLVLQSSSLFFSYGILVTNFRSLGVGFHRHGTKSEPQLY